jgi:DNA-binding transcriptional ArsR family regulator
MTSRHESTLRLLRDPAQVAALMDADRRRLLTALSEEPDSAVGLAHRLGDTRQRLNYHLRKLEEVGLVVLVEERPRRGVKERVLRPVARHFFVDPAALGPLGPLGVTEAEAGDRFSATWLVALAARAVRELAELLHRAGRGRKRLATAGMSARVRLREPADFEPFADELARAVARVVARWDHRGAEGRSFRVVVGSYPGGEEDGDGT